METIMLSEHHADGDGHVEFLLRQEGSRRSHSGRRLIDHLIGVREILRDWGCDPEVGAAGLFHSVYGTEHFKHQTVSPLERRAISELIGDRAENLVHRFSTMKAREFLSQFPEEPVRADGTEIPGADLDLLKLFIANWIEQYPRMKPLHRATHLREFRRLRGIMGEEPRRALDEIYGFDRELVVSERRVDLARLPDGGPKVLTVLDGAVPSHLAIRLTALVEGNIWRYGWRAAPTQTKHGFWHSHFAGDNEDRDEDCEKELVGRPLVEPVLELWRLVRALLAPDQVPVRIYANGHTYGGDGHLHTDCERPGHFTTIYYAHAEWDVNWAGETVFFDEAGMDVVHAVSPTPGRLVHFPGDVPHAARSPGRDCPALRAVIVVKSFRRGEAAE